MRIIDISQAVTKSHACTFSVIDKRPHLSFIEGESVGMYFVTTKLDNFYMNTGTHIDFPGHLKEHTSCPLVSTYPLDRFVGKVAVIDVSQHKCLKRFFNAEGIYKSGLVDTNEFISSFDELMIDAHFITSAIKRLGTTFDSIIGIVLRTGLSSFWVQERREAWEYIYFFSPYFSDDAISLLLKEKLSFVGIDALQIEDPAVNFTGNEAHLVTNLAARDLLRERHHRLQANSNHKNLLGADILIYENLNLAAVREGIYDFVGQPLNLAISGLNDNAVVRPFLMDHNF